MSLPHGYVPGGGAADGWSVTLEEREKHHHLFYSLLPAGGFITGEQARGFFLQSGLPQLVLAQVWALADDDRDGRVDLVGFSVAMKLIKMALLGHPLPVAVPPSTLLSLTGHAAHGRAGAGAPSHLSPGAAPPTLPGTPMVEGPTHAPAFPVSDSFLERRRENMERGEAELQRRREALREAQRKEALEEAARQTAVRRQQLELQREAARSDVEALRRRRDVLTAQLLALAQARQEAHAGVGAVRQSAAECRSRLEAAGERAGLLLAESRRLDAHVSSARGDLEALRAQRAEMEGRLLHAAHGGGGLEALSAEVQRRRAAVQSLREKVDAIEMQIQHTQQQQGSSAPTTATTTTTAATAATASVHAGPAAHAGSAPAFQPPVAIVPPSLAPAPSNAAGALSSSSCFSEQQWHKPQQQQQQGGSCVAAHDAEEWEGGGGGGGAPQTDVGWARFPEFGDNSRPAQPRAGIARSRGSQSERRSGAHGTNSFLERNMAGFPAADGSHGNEGKPGAASAFTPQAPSASAYCPLGSCVRAVALCRFQAVQPNHLAFCTGDVIWVRERQDLWWLGEVSGRSGWFPKSYVRVTDGDAPAIAPPPPLPPPLANGARSQKGPCVAGEEEARRDGRVAAAPSDSWNHSKSRPYTSILRRVSKPKAPAPPIHRQEKCAALFDYTSKEAGDLSFVKGDIIALVSKNDRDWWTGTLNGKTGLFPSNHVEVLTKGGEPALAPPGPVGGGGGGGRDADTKRSRPAGPSRPGGPSPRSVVALYDYCAQNSDELSFVRGQSISVTRQAHADWWEGEAGGLCGLFPSNYVREVLPPESSL